MNVETWKLKSAKSQDLKPSKSYAMRWCIYDDVNDSSVQLVTICGILTSEKVFDFGLLSILCWPLGS